MTLLSGARAPWFLAALAVVFCLALWPGLSGPLMLDDEPNLVEVERYANGEIEARYAIFSNTSGPLGRPLSMASFALDARLFGFDSAMMKRSSLLLHLFAALAVFAFGRLLLRVLELSGGDHRPERWLPWALAAFWLVLPMHTSSVLYIVQRMAMLSALFVILALCMYLWGRLRLRDGRPGGGWALWIGFPALVALATLSKENGVLAVPIALLMELVLFPAKGVGQPRPSCLRPFFAVFLLLPAMLVLAAFVMRPDAFLEGYLLREFSVHERLLTQPRVLWSYVGSLLLPMPNQLGLFQDGFPVSKGLLQPASTLLALLAWAGVAAGAWWVRRSAPVISLGVGFFLIAHSIEASFLPLEIYFDHRNYLPSVGLVLAICGLISLMLSKAQGGSEAFRAMGLLMPILALVTCIWVVHARAVAWSSEEAFLVSSVRASPESPRLRALLAGYTLQQGDPDSARAHVALMAQTLPESHGALVPLWGMLIDCIARVQPSPEQLDEFDHAARGLIHPYTGVVWEALVRQLRQSECSGLDVRRLIAIADRWTSENPAPNEAEVSWRPRYNLASLLAAQGDFNRAADILWEVWQRSPKDRGVGILAFQVHAQVGSRVRSGEILKRLQARTGEGDLVFDDAIRRFEAALADPRLFPEMTRS